MEALREVTDWKTEYRRPNHDYLLDGGKVIAYKKWSDGPTIWLDKPLMFYKTRRKFIKLKVEAFYL